jgi:hypothetical protein
MRSIINAAVFGENRRCWAKNLLRSARNRCDPSEASSDECQRARLDCHRLPRRAVLYHMNTSQGKSAPVYSVKPSTAPSPFVHCIVTGTHFHARQQSEQHRRCLKGHKNCQRTGQPFHFETGPSEYREKGSADLIDAGCSPGEGAAHLQFAI